MKKLLSPFWVLCIISLLVSPGVAAPPPPDPTPLIENAILQAVTARGESFLPAYIFDTQVDNFRLSSDKNWSTAWIKPVDPDTGRQIPTEPGLALAKKIDGTWIAVLPGDPAWEPLLKSLPSDVLSVAEKEEWLRMYSEQPEEALETAVFSGYRLPWEAGKSLILTRSITHYTPPNPSGSMHFAFDFASAWVSGVSPMFNVHAAKAGTVKYARWTQPNGDESSPGNYIVLEDLTTIPPTYQLYLHLAQDSIPPELRNPGTQVAQGQFIGMADDTGYSTGNHLHFQVHTNPASYWGTAVDITFEEVAINGGRPRMPSEASSYPQYGDQGQLVYISANTPSGDITPPVGDFINLTDGSKLQTDKITLQAWAADSESELASVRFLAYFENEWHPIGPQFTASPFSYTWDMCGSFVPDGPISFALELRDSAGNYAPAPTGLRHTLKDYTCQPPPPDCLPGAGQAALYSQSDYSGECIVLSQGDYSSASAFGPLSDNTATSIQLGVGAAATGFADQGFSGRSESFFSNDANLSDNRIGSGTISSLKVRSITAPPEMPLPVWPLSGEIFAAQESISLAWNDTGGGSEFQVELDGNLRSWTTQSFDLLGSLSSGLHSWRVRARNTAGESSWGALQQISVSTTAALPASQFTAPFLDNFEDLTGNEWINSNTWDLTDSDNHTPGGSVSWTYDTNSTVGYDTGSPNHGDLTSPEIFIPATGYRLKFAYKYETESSWTHWDQRWVQISENGNPFQNIYQLSSDPSNVWLSSPSINLSNYSGKFIRVRFHFETLDAQWNQFMGWMIDDFSIETESIPNCQGSDTDAGVADNAARFNLGDSLSASICPSGDLDYWIFSGLAGQRVGARTVAQDSGSLLDTYLYLLDTDGKSILAENDDIVHAVRTDSQVSYLLPHNGDYYFKVRAWDHPSAGGETYTYTLKTYIDENDPIAEIVLPPSYTYLAPLQAIIELDASDPASSPSSAVSGLNHAEFWWHSGDWIIDDWGYLGADWELADGLGFDFDTSQIPDQSGIAIFAKVFDKAGNWTPAAAWGMAIDRTPPVSSLQNLTGTQNSTIVHLEWTAEDNLSGLSHFDIQYSIDGGSWQDLMTNIPATDTQTWVAVDQGHTYSFRMRAVDMIGNTETYPSDPEASIIIPDNVCPDSDTWEPDNEYSTATSLQSNEADQLHNFCNTEPGSKGTQDSDWYRIQATAGSQIWITALPRTTSSAPVLSLYDSDGVTLLASYTPDNYGEVAFLQRQVLNSSPIYLKISHLDGNAAGDSLEYWLHVVDAHHSFIPQVFNK